MGKKIYPLEKSTSVRSFHALKTSALSHLWRFRPIELERLMMDYAFRPSKYRGYHPHEEILSSGKSFFLPVKTTGKYIHVTEIGEGPAVIFAHGWASEKKQLTSFVPKLLAAGFSVLLYDQPAHGKSTSVSTNIFDFIHAMEALVRYRRDVHAILAHSMSTVAAVYNFHLFQWIKKGVLISPICDYEEELMTWFQKRGMPENMIEDVVSYLEERHHLKLEMINPKNVAPYLKAADILLVHDQNDRHTPFKGSERLNLLLPKSEIKKTQHLGHAKILHNENVINDVIEFLKN